MTLSGVLLAFGLLVAGCGAQIHEDPPDDDEPPIVVDEPAIDEARAMEIAAEAGLDPGLAPWSARYYLDPREGYVWSVMGSAQASSDVTSGTTVLIDADTGRVIDFSSWSVIVEEEGVLLIKETQEYESLVREYGSDRVSAKAVNLHEDSEIAFLKEIDPGFAIEPGCIIVLEGGDGEGYVYQLDEDVSIVFRMTLPAFEEGARNVDASTMERFYGSLA